MGANKKKKTTSTGPKVTPSFLTIILPLKNKANDLDVILAPLKTFVQNWSGGSEIIAVNQNSSDNTYENLKNHDFFGGLINNGQAHILNADSHGEGLAKAAYQASGDHIVTWTNSNTVKPTVIRQWATKYGGHFPKNQIIIGKRAFENEKEAKAQAKSLEGNAGKKFKAFTTLRASDPENPVKVYPTSVAQYLFVQTNPDSKAFEAEALHRAQMEGIAISEEPVKFEEGLSFGSASKQNFIQAFGNAIAFKLNYQLKEPFYALLKGQATTRPSELQSPQYGPRLAFTVLILALFLFMPILSFDYGISGDEDVQHNYGEKLVDYYLTLGEDQSALEYKNLYLYGGLFETLASGAARAFNPLFETNYEYEIRHVLNALVGCLALLIVGLFGKYLGGWRGGLLALLLLALSPRFFGHSMNNPKDIPFAAFYIMSLYFMIKFLREFPNPTKRSLIWLIVGIACAINIRIGGLLLIAYFGLFGLLELGRHFYIEKITPNQKKFYFKKALKLGIITVLLGYLGGMVFWPYGHQNPISNPMEVLGQMSDFPVTISILFGGEEIQSSNVPWNYLPTYLLYTTPIICLLGFGLFLLRTPFYKTRHRNHYLAYLLFAVIFPVVYIIYKESNLYDCIRQILFIYPPFVLLSSFAINEIYENTSNRTFQWGITAGVIILLVIPLQYMVRNHPHQYVFYNPIVGGVDNAIGNYELDYWGNSTKPAAKWLGQYLKKKYPADSTVKVVANFTPGTREVLNRYYESFDIDYASFNERSRKNWDYAVYVARFISPSVLKNHWPPNGTIHEVTAGNAALTSVIKRESYDDYKGFQEMEQQNFQKAIQHFENYVKKNPNNETVLTALARAYLQTNQIQDATNSLNQALEIDPTNIRALGLKGSIYKQRGNIDAAITAFENALQQNQGYARAYLELGELYYRKQQPRQALQYLNYLRQVSPRLYQRAEQLVQRCREMLQQQR